ncbi:hypothetical protein KZJ38_11455 [Paraburkholderia edwinii]|uniref:DoxX family protein n=2 Tax=Paraburkholderia edwinii TaxID=2861782 RepID=A0ABX8UI52_9BURK|nr:hypothetical protein KZJ38_11455 [Paraburkholderia edwinii]
MRWLTRSGLLAAVSTSSVQWVVPMRLTFGLLLLFPLDGGIGQVLTVSQTVAQCAWIGSALRAVEIVAGISFLAGLGIRLAACPAVIIFGLRAVGNAAGSFAWLRDFTDGYIVPHGNWGYGALYLGTALLLDDLIGTGSGRWSVDYWLSRKLGVKQMHSQR